PFDVEILVADHVDQDHRLEILQSLIPHPAVDVAPAAINAIVIGPLDDRFFAVEENELELVLELQICRAAGELQEPRSAGSAVACADKPNILEKLGVVMAGDRNDRRFRASRSWT